MNILISNEFFYPHVTGGTEIFLYNFSKYLEKKGHKVVVLTSGNTQREDLVYQVSSSPIRYKHFQQIPGITTPFLLNKKVYLITKKIIKEEKIDVSYVNNIYHLSLSPLQASLESIPTLLDIHDYWPVCFSKDMFFMNKRECERPNPIKCSICLTKKFKLPFVTVLPFLYKELEIKRIIFSSVKNVVVHSEYVKKKMKDFFNEIKVIPYPVMIDKKPKKKKNNEKLKLLFAGRLTYYKGADLIVKVAKYLEKNEYDYEINVLGSGPMEKYLKNKNLNIKLHGFLGEERWKYFEDSNIMLAPSRWPEPFGIIALESAYFRIPIITLTSSGGLKELVKKNKIGEVTDEENLGKTVVNVFENKKKYIRQMKNVVEKYNKKKIFKEFERMLKNSK